MLDSILMQEKNADVHFDIYENRHKRPFMQTIGQRIKARRKQIGLKQWQVADRSGVDQSQISRIERGELEPTDYIYELSRTLETSVKWLKTGIEDMASQQGSTRVVGGQYEVEPFAGIVLEQQKTDEYVINTSIDALVSLYKRSDSETRDMFDSIYQKLKNETSKMEAKKKN